MSNSANFRQNAEQGQALNKLNGLMATHTTSQTTTTASVDALKLSTDTKLDTLNASLGTLNTSVQANVPFNPNTPATYTNSHLSSISTNTNTANTHLSTIAQNSELKAFTDITDTNTAVRLSAENGGKLQVQVVGSNDINGGTPHRHLTIDANGRTLTNPLMSTTNSKLDHLSTDLDNIETEVAKTQTSVYTTNVAGISANSGGATYDLGVNFFRLHKLQISGDMIGITPTNLYLQISSDGSNWSWATGLGFVTVSGGGYGGSFFNTSIDNPMRYWRFYNNDSVATTNQIDNLWYRVNQN